MSLTLQSYPRVDQRQFFATRKFLVGGASGFTSNRLRVTDVNCETAQEMSEILSSVVGLVFNLPDNRPTTNFSAASISNND